jgi:aryl-alcohol dehydrogenase-like predicted oxidoreductase
LAARIELDNTKSTTEQLSSIWPFLVGPFSPPPIILFFAMSNTESCKVVFGAAGPLWREHATEVVEVLREAGVDEIDVAQVYLDSEKTAGDVGAARYFSIGTKELGCGGIIVGDGPPTRENVLRRALHSLKLLKVDQVEIFYIHGPARTTPFEETLEGINELYNMGKFKKFGLSNFLPDEVEKVSFISLFLNPLAVLLQSRLSPCRPTD